MQYIELTHERDIRDVIDLHNLASDYVIFDTETSSLDPLTARLIDIQLSGLEDEVYIFEGRFAPLLLNLDPRIILVAHNSKFDLNILFRQGVDLIDRPFHDTILLGHLLDENRLSYSLESYVKEMTGDDYKDFWKTYKSYEEAPKEVRQEYACKDVSYTRELYRTLIRGLRDDQVPSSLIEHSHRLQRSLLRTEIEGVAVDSKYLLEIGTTLKGRIEELKPKLYEKALVEVRCFEDNKYEEELAKRKTDKGKKGVPYPIFSFDSSPQLQALLYQYLKLPEQRNEKTKNITVDEGALERLKDHHTLLPLLLEYRGLQKTYTAFIEGTESRVRSGRVYPEFRVSGTATGRISHANPNLGQLPKEGGIRGIYVPNPGYSLLSADYSQLEVCLEANLTKDVSLKKIFTEGLSKHDMTSEALGINREVAKTLNFALQYWASHFKVAKILGVNEDAGKRVWNNYWRLYSGPKKLKEVTDRAVNSGESLTTAFGRRRRFQIRRRQPWDSDYRQAYNFLIQSLGADITSRAFYLISEWLRDQGLGRGLFTIHDEILIEAVKGKEALCEAKLLEIMVGVGSELGLEIPLKAESSGPMDRWLD